jgi:hypothetical protein
MKVLITKKTAAETVELVIDRSMLPCTVQVDGTLVAETIPINLLGITGTASVTPAYNEFGDALALSATATAQSFYAPCDIQFVKPITANAVGLKFVN